MLRKIIAKSHFKLKNSKFFYSIATRTTQPDKYENLANIQDKIPRSMLGQRALMGYLEDEVDYETFLKQLCAKIQKSKSIHRI